MISKTGLEALRAAAVLASLPPGAYASAGDIAGKIGAPRSYLTKIFQTLVRAGVAKSQKGKGGGVRLSRRAGALSLYDVVNPVDRLDRWNGCLMGQSRCSCDDPCRAHRQWKNVRDTYRRFLESTSVAELAERKARK